MNIFKVLVKLKILKISFSDIKTNKKFNNKNIR